MSRSRRNLGRQLAAPLALAVGVLPLLAPTCGGTGAVQDFTRGSIIIPMDMCYQYQTDGVSTSSSVAGCPQAPDGGNVIRAYGLVYQLVRNNIAVYWIINPSKAALTDPDLTIQYDGGAPAFLYDWGSGAVSGTAPTSGHSITYRGGPFVVDGSDFARAASVIQSYQSLYGAVNLHVSNVAFRANVGKTMAGGWNAGGTIPPKLALLDIGSAGAGVKNSEVVIQGYLTQAGLDFNGAGGYATGTHGQIYDRLYMTDFWPDASGQPATSNLFRNGYQVLWIPHWAAPSSCSDCLVGQTCSCRSGYTQAQIDSALRTIGAFSTTGHDVFAECAGLGSLEGVSGNGTYATGASDASTHLETTAGAGTAGLSRIMQDTPGPASFLGNFASPFMQLGDFVFRPWSGAISDYQSSLYRTETVRLISDTRSSGTWDVFTMVPRSSGHGTVVYLGGHSYSGTDGGFQIGGTRLVLNTLFNLGAGCVASGVTCNTGKLGVCAVGTMQCDPATGLPVCVQTTGQSPEVCNGLDDDCNGLVDDGLDTGCYDGPAATRNKGICRDGVRTCQRNADGSYAMSACTGQVLPSAEVCNGLDDDCNGYTDDDPAVASGAQHLQQPCYTGPSTSLDATTGYPRGICKAGIQTCDGGVWSSCPVCSDAAQPWKTPDTYPTCEILPHQEICGEVGQQYDMNCNGIVADGCGCTAGATQPCYRGPPGTQGNGPCKAGTQTCQAGATGSWGTCTGDVLPGALDCTKPPASPPADNNCNGVPDYTEPGCNVCPSPADLVCYDGSPATFVLLGGPTPAAGGGTLAAGTYRYVVTALTAAAPGESYPSNEQAATLTAAGSVSLSWSAFPGATGYRIYRGATAGQEDVFFAPAGTATSFTDIGAATTAGAPPARGLCQAGAHTCTNGVTGAACSGEILPSTEVCDGKDNDCNGLVDDGALCPAGQACINGACVPSSCGVERPCPEGYACSAAGACETAPCGSGPSAVACGPGAVCRYGLCTDPCAGVTCGAGTFCQAGSCTAGGCYVDGCRISIVLSAPAASTTGGTLSAGTYFYRVTAFGAPGESLPSNEQSVAVSGATGSVSLSWTALPSATTYRVYRGTVTRGENTYWDVGSATGFVDTNAAATAGAPPVSSQFRGPIDPSLVCRGGACVADPCTSVACPSGTFCREGDCVQACVFQKCPAGQRCGIDGFCVADPCAGVSCQPNQLCQNGACVANPCLGVSCGAGLACQGGTCVDDPCADIVCPVGVCVSGQCYPTENPTGGGGETTIPPAAKSSKGCGCGSGPGTASSALLLLALLPLARRRRGARAWRARQGGFLLLAAAVALGGAGCKKSSKTTFDPASCAASGQVTCGDEQVCVTLASDPLHCGSCTHACGAAEQCVESTCGPATAVAPYAASASPAQAPKGAVAHVTITGERFQAGAKVRVIAPDGNESFATTVADAGHLAVDLDFTASPTTSVTLRVVNPDATGTPRVISNALPFDVVTPTPHIDSVTPTTAAAGLDLAVTGTGFVPTSVCHVSGPGTTDLALPTTVGTSLACAMATAGLSPGTWQLWVVNEGTIASNQLPFTVAGSGTAHLTALSPAAAAAGDVIDLLVTGTAFTAGSVVTFDGASQATTFQDSNHLLAHSIIMPACASSPCNHAVTVVGADNALNLQVSTTAPRVTTMSVSPTPLYQGDPASLTFDGTGLETATGGSIQPPAGTATPTLGTVTATQVGLSLNLATGCSLNPCPAGLYTAALVFPSGNSASFQFRVLSSTAVLQSASPAGSPQGWNGTVTLTGSNFRGAAADARVLLTGSGGVNRSYTPATWGANSATFALDLAGFNTGVYALAVQNAGAAMSNQVSFSVTPGPPRLDSITPSATLSVGSVPSGTRVDRTLNGINFALPDANGNAASQVMYSVDGATWRTLPANVTIQSSTQILVQIDPRDVIQGSYSIQVWNPPGPQQSASVTFTVTQ